MVHEGLSFRLEGSLVQGTLRVPTIPGLLNGQAPRFLFFFKGPKSSLQEVLDPATVVSGHSTVDSKDFGTWMLGDFWRLFLLVGECMTVMQQISGFYCT